MATSISLFIPRYRYLLSYVWDDPRRSMLGPEEDVAAQLVGTLALVSSPSLFENPHGRTFIFLSHLK